MSLDEKAPPVPQLGPTAYRALFDASSDALVVHEPDGTIVLVNAQVRAMFGWSPEDIGGLSIGDLSANVEPYTKARALTHFRRALADGFVQLEWRGRRRSGDVFWCELTLRGVELEGRPHVIASVRDIDARKRAEHALRESDERFAKIFNASSTLMAFTEPPHGTILDVNDAWLAASGLRREDVVGQTGRALGTWPNIAQRDAILRALEETGRVVDAECDQRMNGRVFPTLMNAEYIEIRGTRYILWEIRDLSERKRAEREQGFLREQLLQAQRMESVGQLAGGLAHDFNNIISVILGFTSLVLRDTAAEDKSHAHLTQVLRAGERASALIRQLLTFSRKQVVQPKVLRPVAVLHEIEPMLRRLINDTIELRIAPGQESDTIWADLSQFELAMMNLVVNARDAMPAGGTVSFEVSNFTVDEAYAAAHAEAQPGPYVLVAVSDTGTGMDAETRARVFEPFFTTKGVGHGTGLGLSTVHGIVKQCGGWIGLHSELGRGTTFRLYFPRSVAALPPIAPGAVPSPKPPPGTTVLVVDDDDQNRLFVRIVLTEAGYDVLEASSPVAALALERECTGAIHLLVTDVVMPQMNGKQLAERFLVARPATRVLYMSGYTKDAMLAQGIVESNVHFLPKPLTSTDLLATAARLLAP